MNSDTRVHHPYSPSTLAALESCPCHISKQSEVLHERTIAGTIAHEAVERGEDDARLSDEDAVAVAECLDLVEQRKTAMAANGGVTEIKEAYLPVDNCVFDDAKATTAGYVDHVLVSYDKKHAEIMDWKFGRWGVENAEKNLQGIAYALGLFHRYPSLETITVWFKQPRIGVLTSATFPRSAIPKLYLRVQVVVERARVARKAGDFSSANPTVPNCNFCAHIGVCPAVAKIACEVGKKFYPAEIPEDITPTKIHDAKGSTLGMRLAGLMKVWGEAYRSRMTDRVLRGDADCPQGFAITLGTSRRSVISEAKLREVALRYISSATYDTLRGAPGFGDIEKAVAAAAARGVKTKVLEQFSEELVNEGAVKKGEEYPYLRAVDEKSEKVVAPENQTV